MCWQGCASSEGSKEGSDLSPSFWWFLGLWQHTSTLHVGISLCAYLSLYPKFPPFSKDTSHTE